ncbi:MAG: hypothetical protein V1775_05320 [Bacteroidota bacterium]
MKKTIFLIGFLVSIVLFAVAQTNDSTITIQKKRYYQDEKVLSKNQLKSLLMHCQASSPEYRKARSSGTTGSIILGTGSMFVLVGAGINLAGSIQEANDVSNGTIKSSYPNGLGLILVGVAIDLVSIPFMVSSGRHFRKSVNNYNASFEKADSRSVKLNLVYTQDGLGLRMHF